MIKDLVISILTLMASLPALAGPFSELEVESAPQSKCLYSDIYSATSTTYLMLNVVELLSSKRAGLSSSLEQTVSQTILESKTACGSKKDMNFKKLEYTGTVLSFVYGSGRHSVEWASKKGSDFVIYKKLYGTYRNEPLMVIEFKNSKKTFTRVTGRLGAENSNTRYTFYYKPDALKPFQQTVLKNKEHRQIKSLKSIYGKDVEKESPTVRVGVIGTGIDYNHPGMAKYLAYRFEMEQELQKLEVLQAQLRRDPFVTVTDYMELALEFEKLKEKTGFPEWMDQALGTKEPFDSVIINQKRSNGTNREHETRVASRMVRTGGPVEIHFARRSMGSVDTLDVHEVVDQFAAKGVRLVNLSFGSKCGGLPKEEKMWDEVFAKYPGIVFVVSAGNSGFNISSTPFCPATYSQKYKNVISVTALDGDGQLAVYYDTPVNFGDAVDLAIKSNNLEVLIPYRKTLKWENNANGATSLAAAEVSRILTESLLEGLSWDAQTVKDQLISTSVKHSVLEGVNKTSSEVDEWAFRVALRTAL